MTRHRRGDLRAALETLFAAQRERLQRPWFAPLAWDSPLAEEIAAELVAEHPSGHSLAELRSSAAPTGGAIRSVLRSDDRVVSSGEARGRRWRLAPEAT